MTGSRFRSYSFLRSGRCLRGLVAISLLLPVSLSADSGMARLEVTITGIREITGAIAVAIFDSEESFDERLDPVAQMRRPIQADSVAWSIELAVPATYAVIAYHDLNDNGEIDMSRFGRPQEPYGFSNNVRGRFGPPGFDEAAIDLEHGVLSVTIEID